MDFFLVNLVRQNGVGSKSGKAYDFTIAEGLIETPKGRQMCKLMLDKDHPALQVNTKYRIEIELYPDREARLAMRVAGLRPVVAATKVA
jgi:hypothetical protein